MPTATVNGAALHYIERGAGARAILFAHGFLWNGAMFDNQINALQDRYRCVAADFRGQGGSEVTPDGYDMGTLTADLVALIERLDLAPCHFVGLSMGGFVGQRLAVHHPHLLRSLTLMETSADPEPAFSAVKYRLLGLVARTLGLGVVAGPVMKIMFGDTFRQDPARADERARLRAQLLANDRVGVVRALQGVVGRHGYLERLGEISLPTLILVGDEDVATPPLRAQRMQARLPHARLVTIPGAGHTSSIEAPAAVTAALSDFLDGVDACGAG